MSNRLPADFSTETLQARIDWKDMFKILKDKKNKSRIHYSEKLFFRNEGGRKAFPDKQWLKNVISVRPALQEMLKEALQAEQKAELH